MVELRAERIGVLLQVRQGPAPEFHRGRDRAGAGVGPPGADAAQLDDPTAEDGEKNLADHRHRKLAALDRLRPLVGGLELGVHPLVAEETRAVLGDAVAADQAHRVAHDVGAMAGVPELGGGAEDVGLRVEDEILDERIALQRLVTRRITLRFGPGGEVDEFQRRLREGAEGLHLRHAAGDALLGELAVLDLLQRIEFVEEARGGETERRGRLASGPDIDQTLQAVLLLLQSLIVARRAWADARRAAEAAAVVADDGLDGREELGGGHDADGDAGTAEDRLDDLAVAVIGDDHAVLHGVAADDAAGRHLEAENRVSGRGKLVDHLARRHAAVIDAGVGFLEDHDAAAFDARIGAVDGGGREVGEAHVGDEAGALVYLEHRLFALRPLRHADLAAEQAGLDADVGQRLGEAEGAAPDLPLLAGLRRHAARHVGIALRLGAALVDGREREVAGEAAGGGAGIDPGQFVGDESEHEVLGALDEAALLRIHEAGRDAGLVERLQQAGLLRRPVMTVAGARGHQAGHDTAGHGSGRLDQHLEVIPVLIAPHDLAHIVAGQRLQGFTRWGYGRLFHINPFCTGGVKSYSGGVEETADGVGRQTGKTCDLGHHTGHVRAILIMPGGGRSRRV